MLPTKFKLNTLKKYMPLLFYVVFLLLELTAIHHLSDLPSILGNWLDKTRQLANFDIPNDNFYGPGAAILLLPFHFFPEHLFAGNLFYFGLGAIGYWLIASQLNSRLFRAIVLAALPLNSYLLWLVNSSQDTVFEFCLLTWALYFLSKRNDLAFAFVGFILCSTRAGYWVFLLGTVALLGFLDMRKFRRIFLRKLIVIPLLVCSSGFNYVNYGSVSPALEGGITAYFSYTKYHYLSLPKMDMDAFLSGEKGAFSKGLGPEIPVGASQAEENSIYQRAAIDSAISNPKETLLGLMQKFDSYVFDVQKIPHLPGHYVLDEERLIIEIKDERLNWSLVLGNLVYEIYRSLLLFFGFTGIGLLIGARFFQKSDLLTKISLWPLALPWIFGIIPGLLFYTESRFKVVTELLLIPLIAQIWSSAVDYRKNREVNY